MNLDKELLNRQGESISGPENDPVTVRQVLLTAIDGTFEDDHKMETATKLKLARLGMKLENKETKTLTAGEVTVALERAAKAYNPLVYGQIVQELDPGQL